MAMKLIDTHQHLWDLSRFSYAWCAGIPQLNRSFLPEDYRAAAEHCGIEKTVFVECDVDEPHALDEARHIQSIADKNRLIAGIVAGGKPEREGFREHLDQLAKLSLVRGLRRVLHTQPDELSQNTLFVKNLQLLSQYALTFDLCVQARQLPIAMTLVRKCSEVSFILDHCGVPDVKGRALDPWRGDIRRLAELPNLHCKISGLVAYADPLKWTVEDLRPWVKHVIECFGWNRVVWGGDWPVCTLSATFKQWVDATMELTRHAAESDREKLFWRNAERIYRI